MAFVTITLCKRGIFVELAFCESLKVEISQLKINIQGSSTNSRHKLSRFVSYDYFTYSINGLAYTNDECCHLASFCDKNRIFGMGLTHRDKPRVQMPAKIFPHLKVKC